jgi:soluble lytic murein transglycosylase-like protein
MKITKTAAALGLLALAIATVASASDERRFSAGDVPRVRLQGQGRVVISNDAHSISAFRFFGNVREALVTLRTSRALAYHSYGSVLFDSAAAPSAQTPAYLTAVIAAAAREHGVDPRLVAAVASRESAWNPNAVSRTGACGLMQLMPDTARFLGITNIFDPHDNLFAGVRYLRTLLDTFHGDLDLTLAAYNAGPGAVQKYNGVPPYRETQAYVRNVRATYERSLAAK